MLLLHNIFHLETIIIININSQRLIYSTSHRAESLKTVK